jgi:uncharacterized protein (TIGR03437 family)
LENVSVQIGNAADGQVVSAGGTPAMPAGYFQVMVTVPGDAPSGGAVPIVVMVGSTASQAGVTIAIQ